ncbi:hypothetical protein CYD30_12685 [Kosakonia cowanii]|nr:hypothetical protein CYD30_12685 [Kosakonia cowanii]
MTGSWRTNSVMALKSDPAPVADQQRNGKAASPHFSHAVSRIWHSAFPPVKPAGSAPTLARELIELMNGGPETRRLTASSEVLAEHCSCTSDGNSPWMLAGTEAAKARKCNLELQIF